MKLPLNRELNRFSGYRILSYRQKTLLIYVKGCLLVNRIIKAYQIKKIIYSISDEPTDK